MLVVDTHLFMRVDNTASAIINEASAAVDEVARRIYDAMAPLPPEYQIGLIVGASFATFLAALYWLVMFFQPQKFKYLGEEVDTTNEQRVTVEPSFPGATTTKEIEKEEAEFSDSSPCMVDDEEGGTEDMAATTEVEEIKKPRKSKSPLKAKKLVFAETAASPAKETAVSRRPARKVKITSPERTTPKKAPAASAPAPVPEQHSSIPDIRIASFSVPAKERSSSKKNKTTPKKATPKKTTPALSPEEPSTIPDIKVVAFSDNANENSSKKKKTTPKKATPKKATPKKKPVAPAQGPEEPSAIPDIKIVAFSVNANESSSKKNKKKKQSVKKDEEEASVSSGSSTADETSGSEGEEAAAVPKSHPKGYQTPYKPRQTEDSEGGLLFTPSGRRSARLMRKNCA